MRFDDDSGSSNFEVQDGSSRAGFGGGGGLGLLGMLVPFVFSKFGCGGVVVLGIVVLLFGGLGNIGSMFSGGGQVAGPQQTSAPGQLSPVQETSRQVLGSTEQVWGRLFAASGQRYTPTVISFYDRNGRSGCGAAQAAMGPFYCPSDQRIYLDTAFFEEMRTRMGVAGDFPIGYVIAHEVGHHIQTIDGTAERVRAAQSRASRTQGNALQVAMELQADCYAGVWAAGAKLESGESSLEPGDVEEGLAAAQAIGDDTQQRASQGVVVPESFTHGSAAQRQQWLKRGLTTGDPAHCDTFGR